MAYGIEVSELTKKFVVKSGPLWRRQKSDFIAVNRISFSVPQGEIFGLLGPNGAGKSTTIKVLATLLLPDSGVARVQGLDVTTHSLEVRRLLGTVLPGERSLYWKLTVRENLNYFACLLGLPGALAKERIRLLLKEFELQDQENILVEKLSTGLRQRAVLCRALLADPQIILLDEPTLGLDPVAARSLRQFIRQLKSQGKTILLTTHYMYEADELADTVGIINAGNIVAHGSPAILKQELRLKRAVELKMHTPNEAFVGELGKLNSISNIEEISRDGDLIVRFLLDEKAPIQDVLALTQQRGVSLQTFRVDEPSLEDVFVAHSKKSSRTLDGSAGVLK